MKVKQRAAPHANKNNNKKKQEKESEETERNANDTKWKKIDEGKREN